MTQHNHRRLPASHLTSGTHMHPAGGAQTSDPGQAGNGSHVGGAGVAARRTAVGLLAAVALIIGGPAIAQAGTNLGGHTAPGYPGGTHLPTCGCEHHGHHHRHHHHGRHHGHGKPPVKHHHHGHKPPTPCPPPKPGHHHGHKPPVVTPPSSRHIPPVKTAPKPPAHVATPAARVRLASASVMPTQLPKSLAFTGAQVNIADAVLLGFALIVVGGTAVWVLTEPERRFNREQRRGQHRLGLDIFEGQGQAR